jgi:caffeoyl-CoA O-methyltransferase
MSSRSYGLSDELHSYVLSVSTAPDPVQQHLIEVTAELGRVSGMQISPEQGQFMTQLVTLLSPLLVVEVGTFTGYSSLAMAKGLPEGGRIIACDVSDEWTTVAREHWERAGVADRIELRLGPGIDTLRALEPDLRIDLAFIDADKPSYLDYYEEVLSRLSERGVILVDNTLWSGAVARADDTSESTVALRAFNAHVAADPRTVQVLLPIGDGLTMITRA